MNHLPPRLLAAALALLAAPAALAQSTAYTTPVGYVTHEAHASASTLLALLVHQSTKAAGSFDIISGTTLTDIHGDFTTALSDSTPYLVELRGGMMDGMVLDVVSFTAHTLTVAETLPAASDIAYHVRAVPRLSEIIHPLQPLAVDDFNPDNGDLILIPSGAGQFDQYYSSSRVNHMGYFNAATGRPEDPLLRYTKAFFYLRRGAESINFVVSGEVKMESTLLSVTDTFNYLGTVNPSIKLGGISLELSLKPGTADTADIIWLQDAAGDFKRYFYSDGTPPLTVGWRLVNAPAGDENAEQGEEPIMAGMIIQRRASAPYHALLIPPYGYSNYR